MTGDCYRPSLTLCIHLGPSVIVCPLAVEVDGLPTPQFTATALQDPVTHRSFPLDCRGLGLGICVVDAPIAATPFTLAHRAQIRCSYASLHPRVARRDATAVARHTAFLPFEALPWSVDSVALRVSPSGVSFEPAPSSSQHTVEWIHGIEDQRQEVRDMLDEQFQDGDTYLVMVHSVNSAPVSAEASRSWRAEQLADAIALALGSSVDVHWPGLVPGGTDALLHVVVAQHKLSEDQTLILFDGAALRPIGPRFNVLITPKLLTLGEIFCFARDAFPSALVPAEMRVNGRVLESASPRTYYCPLVRPVPARGAIHRPGVFVTAGIKPQLIVEELPGLAVDLQQAQQLFVEHVSFSNISEEISAVSLLQTQSMLRHTVASASTSVTAAATKLRVWRPFEGMCELRVRNGCRTEEVAPFLLQMFDDFCPTTLTPVFPQDSGSLQCVLPARGTTDDALTVLLCDDSTGHQEALCVVPPCTASQLIAQAQLPPVELLVDDQVWAGTHQGCYHGMRLRFRAARSKQTPSFVRALPTPCRSSHARPAKTE